MNSLFQVDDILSECHGYGDESFERSFTLYKPGTRKPVTHQARGQVSFFFTLVTGPSRSLSLKLSDTRVYGPQVRALLGTASHFCEVVVLKLRTQVWQFPETRNLKPETRNPKSQNRLPKPGTRSMKLGTRKPESEARNPRTENRDSELGTRNPNPIPDAQYPKTETRNPKPENRYPIAGTRCLKPESRNPTPGARNPIPQSRKTKTETQHPIPETQYLNSEISGCG